MTTRPRIAARCGPLRLWRTKKDAGGDMWEMKGGKFGPHTIYAACYSARVHSHWFGYCENNGQKPNAADNCPPTSY